MQRKWWDKRYYRLYEEKEKEWLYFLLISESESGVIITKEGGDE